MSSTTAQPPPGGSPGGLAGDPLLAPSAAAPPSHHTSQAPGSEGDDRGGGLERCGRGNPRPPVPGGEVAPTSDHHRHHHQEYGEWGKESPITHLFYQPHLLCAHFQGLAVDGGGDGPALGSASMEAGSPCWGEGESSCTPPPMRWSQSLMHLLEDDQGVKLFQKYLKEECGTDESVLFWFACNGLKKDDHQDYSQLVPIIWKRFIRNYTVQVTEKTYKMINDRINARSIDRNIFDAAQKEVEEEIGKSTYPSFLKSDTYLNYLSQATHAAGAEGADSPRSPSPGSPAGVSMGALPTLHEDCEFESSTAPLSTHLPLTQEALAATVKRRAAPERRKAEVFAGQYLHGRSRWSGGGVNPYHAAYSTVHVSSRQDSELQSLSSDALTDDTLSCTDSSVDGRSMGHYTNPKYLKRQYHKMRENARQNLCLNAGGPGGGGPLHGVYHFLPRTHRIKHEAMIKPKPEEFAAMLTEKLEKVKREQESQEKVHQSFKKIQEGDNVSDECRREHAFNSLPPSVLLDKLAQKIPLEDDHCQSILDEHVSRVWEDSNNDTPARSPGSPRPRSPPGGRRSGSLQSSRPMPPPQHSKGVVMMGAPHPSMCVAGNYLPPGGQLLHPTQLLPGHLPHLHAAAHHLPPGHPAHLPLGHTPHPYQASKNWGHPRRRDRDVYSTFSSDSGNVADYYDSSERAGPHPIPKSRSMPDYMENYAGTSSDGGSSGRRQAGGRRSSSRRAPADLTDSGVSVVSDSGPSLTPSAASTDRRSSSSGGRRSVGGLSVGGTSGSNTSMAAASSLVGGRSASSQERWPGTGGEQVGPHPAYTTHLPHTAHGPQPGLQPHLLHQEESKKRSRGGGGSHGSGRSGGHSSSHSSGHSRGHSEAGSGRGGGGHSEAGGPGSAPAAPSSGSNGSTLRRQRGSRHSQPPTPGAACESGGSSSGGSGGGGSSYGAGVAGGGGGGGGGGSSSTSSATEVTTIVYNFHDDTVPFVTRVPTCPVTLKRFKQHLPKKGNYRFFFKKECEEFGLINEEITEDHAILPLYEGKIFAQIRKAD